MSIERDIREASKDDPHAPIVVGSELGGPELEKSPQGEIVMAYQSLVWRLAKEHHNPIHIKLNIVFFLSGSIIQYDASEVSVVRFSRKQQTILTHANIPDNIIEPHEIVDFLINSSRKAVILAQKVCQEKEVVLSHVLCNKIIDNAEIIFKKNIA